MENQKVNSPVSDEEVIAYMQVLQDLELFEEDIEIEELAEASAEEIENPEGGSR
ncbi:MAG: hypothetical protein ACK5RO_03060 [Pseudobdellovibrionaceae bacterium]|jgi:hypothetical protein